MKKIVFSDLICPIPYRVNENVERLKFYSWEWVNKFKLVATEAAEKRFIKAKFFQLIAGAYPNCGYERLKIANDWLVWFITWDDVCDLPHLAKNPSSIKMYYERFLKILNGSEVEQNDIPHCHALADVRNRILDVADEQWYARFIDSMEDLLASCLQEVFQREHTQVPSVESYCILRRGTGAMGPLIDFIEFCDDYEIPYYLRYHSFTKQLRTMANNIICWRNDIFSAPKEMAVGDVNNLVMALQNQYNLEWEEAMQRSLEIFNHEVYLLLDLEANKPSFGKDVDFLLDKYISGINAWVASDHAWYNLTERYEDNQEVRLAS